MKTNQSGFTLVESLVVLSTFLLIASLSVFLIMPHYKTFEKEQFISLFKSDILYSQQYAISQQKRLIVYISIQENYYYVIEEGAVNPLLKRDIPSSIKLEQGSLGNLTINFNILQDGGTTKFGTFFFRVGDERYKVVFLIGAGRFYVVKE